MTKADRRAFLRQLVESEKEMDALFRELAVEIGNAVLRAQGSDGKVPLQALPQLQRQAELMVKARFLDSSGRGFDDANEPLAPFPRIVAEGQRAMVRQALEETAKILDKMLPEDLRQALAMREIKQP